MKTLPLKTDTLRRAVPLSALAVGLLTAGAAAADTTLPTVNVPASATVAATLSASVPAGLAFGAFTSGTTAGTVVINPDGANSNWRTSTGGVTLLSNLGISRGQVDLVGSPGLAYTVALPSTVVLTNSINGRTMQLSTMTSSLASSGSGYTGNIRADTGTGSFWIGGTLTVPANQEPGAYTGTIPVTITHQ